MSDEGLRLRPACRLAIYRLMPESNVRADVLGAIGETPLIRLARASAETGCEILGKAEFMNPGHSIKDRAALYIVQDAERRGQLKPGGRIVEGTAGNTGIGLAMVRFAPSAIAPRSSFRRTQSQERRTPFAWRVANWWRWTPFPMPIRTTTSATPGALAEEL